MKAASFVAERLHACLPPGVPPSYREIVSARYERSGAARVAIADLIMVDGLPGRVQISTIGLMPQRYTDLPGGDLSFEGGRWIRIDPVTLEPFPAQADMFTPPSALSQEGGE